MRLACFIRPKLVHGMRERTGKVQQEVEQGSNAQAGEAAQDRRFSVLLDPAAWSRVYPVAVGGRIVDGLTIARVARSAWLAIDTVRYYGHEKPLKRHVALHAVYFRISGAHVQGLRAHEGKSAHINSFSVCLTFLSESAIRI